VVGAKGIILDPRGKQQLSYEWGLGTTTKNYAEVYALLYGLLYKCSWSEDIDFIGDSSITINLINNKKTPIDRNLAYLIERMKKEIVQFKDFTFFQVLRALNH
jgi:ribonuclease HI